METPLLFDATPPYPDGFSYVRDFITTQEERWLIEAAESLELHPLVFQGFEAKRKVESFGYDYNFDRRTVSKGKPIPAAFDFLLYKVASELGMPSADLAELLVSEYPKGSVINWHRDAPPFDIIIGVSLLSDCTFRLRPYDKAKQGRKAVRSYSVERRSLYIMRGPARQEWEHSISPVPDKRYSVMLRTLAQ